MNTSLISQRPIFELISPKTTEPLATRTFGRELRRFPRYRRQLSGRLIAGDCELDVTCLDMSWRGTQVVVGEEPAVSQGDRVTLQVHHNGDLYQDEYFVVGSHATSEGVAMNLKR